MMKLRTNFLQLRAAQVALMSLLGLFLFVSWPAHAMNKAELIDAIASDAGLSKADARRALQSFIASTAGALREGDRVALAGFGSFSISKRTAPGSCEEVAEVDFDFDSSAEARLCTSCNGCTAGDEEIATKMESDTGFEQAMKVIASIKRRITAELFDHNEAVNISGFGRFSVVAETEITRTGRNPQSGKDQRIRAKRVAKFKAGSDLAGSVN